MEQKTSKFQATAPELLPGADLSPTDQIIARFPKNHSCCHCKADLLKAFDVRASYPLTFLRDKASAIKAAQSGCHFYQWFLVFFYRSESPDDHGFYLERTSLSKPNDITSIRFLIGTLTYTWPCAAFEVFTEADNPAASVISSRPFNDDFTSSGSVGTARRWIDECNKSHVECGPPTPGFTPTRLIDLGEHRSENRIRIVRCDPSAQGDSPYATLSYCWGGSQSVTTTKATIAHHEIGIEVETLDQTLQDAVQIARCLGIRFLWVDSLCIIQDDPTDMTHEITKMSQYDENGYVSICASVASRSSEGFLALRKNDPFYQGPFELPHHGNGTEEGSIKLAQYRQYSKELDPVTSRAWIMQETLLAPRILSYSYQSISWSCRRTSHSDGGPSTGWYDFKERSLWANLQIHRNVDIYLSEWMRLVESYTSRSLSNSTDRLPAISGIAQKYSSLLQQRLQATPELRFIHRVPGENEECIDYVAGLWYCNIIPKLNPRTGLPFSEPPSPSPRKLIHQLLWSTSYHSTHQKQFHSTNLNLFHQKTMTAATQDTALATLPSLQQCLYPTSRSYLAPTWSWAASNLPVYFESVNKYASLDASFVDCTTVLKALEAPYSQCRSGNLVVKGVLIPILHGPRSRDLHKIWSFTFRPDTSGSDSVLDQILHRTRDGWVLQLTGEGGPLSTEPKPKNPIWTSFAAKGLVLAAEGDNYFRIGLCSIEGHDTDVSRWREVDAFETYGEKKPITII